MQLDFVGAKVIKNGEKTKFLREKLCNFFLFADLLGEKDTFLIKYYYLCRTIAWAMQMA